MHWRLLAVWALCGVTVGGAPRLDSTYPMGSQANRGTPNIDDTGDIPGKSRVPPPADRLYSLAWCEARSCQGECDLSSADKASDSDNFCSPFCSHDEECASVCECANRTIGEDRLFDESARGVPLTPELHCREDRLLSVRWDVREPADDVVFVLEYMSADNVWLPGTITRRRIGAIRGLTPDKAYRVRVTAVGPSGQRGVPAASTWLRTMPSSFTPEMPTDVRLKTISYEKTRALAKVVWTPAADATCWFSVLWFSSGVQHHGQGEFVAHHAPFQATLSKLQLGDNYTVFVKAFSPNWKTEAARDAYLPGGLRTQTCLQAHHNNLSICPPEPVKNLTIREELPSWFSAAETPGDAIPVDITVSWARPAAQPDTYHVVVMDNDTLANVTVPGNKLSTTLHNISVPHVFSVNVWARSEAGNSAVETMSRYLGSWPRPAQGLTTGGVATAVMLVVVLFGAIAAFLYWWWHRQEKAREKERRRRYFEELDRRADKVASLPGPDSGGCDTPHLSLYPEDEWEIERGRLVLGDELGSGAFGTVRHALLSSGEKMHEVAVKMLRDNPSHEEIRQFRIEIEMMKGVGQHPNIVSMLGCVTRGTRALLVVEYCPLGDLQGYLKKEWEMLTCHNSSSVKYAELSHSDDDDEDYCQNIPKAGINGVSNETYGLGVENCQQLSAADLLSFARQVAIGMEFLGSSRVVHRDLAARNVLVCADRTVKISDFGLSRDIYEQNIYRKNRKNGSERIPVKWMAMESLLHQVYTTQTDVWSFGVLLWEIVTLGASPYPTVPNNCLISLLSSGYRMERPSSCSPELYSIMLQCWDAKPANRPSFSELRQRLEELLSSAGPNVYLKLDQLS